MHCSISFKLAAQKAKCQNQPYKNGYHGNCRKMHYCIRLITAIRMLQQESQNASKCIATHNFEPAIQNVQKESETVEKSGSKGFKPVESPLKRSKNA